MFARVLLLALAAALPVVDLLFAQPPAAPPRKVAFLVGVGKYDHNFKSLGIAPENDVSALAKALPGFEVVTLTGSKVDADPHRATKKNINARFKELLEGAGGKRAIRDGDTVLVVLCGHGIEDGEKEPQPYFCPVDARPDDTATMVPLNALIRASESFGGTSLFLVDACREVPQDPNCGGRTGIQGKKISLPDKTAVLFACGSGQLSHQSETLNGGHGLFTFAVLKVLGGGGRVTWTKLVNGVEEEFESERLKPLITDKRGQQPVEAKGQLGVTELVIGRKDISATPPADAPMVPRREMAKGVVPKEEVEEFEFIADDTKKKLGKRRVISMDAGGEKMGFVRIGSNRARSKWVLLTSKKRGTRQPLVQKKSLNEQ